MGERTIAPKGGLEASASGSLRPANHGLFALHDLYNPDGTKTTASGAPIKTIVLSVGEVWCSPCVPEGKALGALTSKVAPVGVQFVKDLYQGPNAPSGVTATQGDLSKSRSALRR